MAPDQPDPLDARSEARVRRLLAEARHDEPMPAEVAARLEQVLAGLSAEPPVPDDVVELHRRRRRASQLLIAAAAVVAVGFGAQQVLQESTGGSGADAGVSAERRPQPANSPAEDHDDSPRNGLTTSQDAESGTADEGKASRSTRDAVRIRPDRFAFDVRHARKAIATSAAAYDASGGELDLLSGLPIGCRVADEGAGRRVPVRYGGRTGVLVYRQPQGDSQVVDLYLCGYDDVVRTVTLSHP